MSIRFRIGRRNPPTPLPPLMLGFILAMAVFCQFRTVQSATPVKVQVPATQLSNVNAVNYFSGGAFPVRAARDVLATDQSQPQSKSEAFRIPEVIRYGSSLVKMQSGLHGLCASIRTRRIDPPFLDHVNHEQMQIDFAGFPFQGGVRHAEFVFRDGDLAMVWIVIGASEETVLERAMTTAFGASKNRGRKYLQYKSAGAALGLDKHEVLFYSSNLAAEIETWYLDAEAKSK